MVECSFWWPFWYGVMASTTPSLVVLALLLLLRGDDNE